jgi:hypothetical protein
MTEDTSTRVEQLEERRKRIHVTMEISRFRLPPVESALVVGKRAGIGPKAMEKALAEMLPETFTLLEVEHEIIEAVIVRAAHLRRVPQEKLIALILRNCEGQMDDTEMLHFEIDVRLRTVEEIEV